MSATRASETIVLSDLPPLDVVLGTSPRMIAARDTLLRIANTDVPVLMEGESGTGKETFAKVLHACSNRANSRWVKMRCAATPRSLIDLELFGYEKWAFPGASGPKRGRVELGNRGTLFLDSIDSLDRGVQAKLLQLAQNGTFTRVGGKDLRTANTRLIGAVREDPQRQYALEPDLPFRVSAVTVTMPPLRQRIQDLPIMVDYFLDRYSQAFGRDVKPVSANLVGAMQCYSWPGNIRQLENMIRAYVLIGNEEALLSDLGPAPPALMPNTSHLSHSVPLKGVITDAIQNLEHQVIAKALIANRLNYHKTAKWLGISYRSLLRKLQGAEPRNSVDEPSGRNRATLEFRLPSNRQRQ